MQKTLAELTARTGVEVLDHLEREVLVPVVAGLQAQGDLIVVPLAMADGIQLPAHGAWNPVPAAGIEVVRGATGANPHVLVADPGKCRWTTLVFDHTGLAIGCLDTSDVAYLLHPEHGGSGIAPGCYVIRRQRERTGAPGSWGATRMIAD
ncbi:hypothetical protein [Nocardia arthritidis]|uniref:Uncharacterized protein n=1 Tax=Nocardia arthritidis TaxID=228602 RepID=A0A6G9Y6J1_9NOCA|nr:hypothetical protein [Nocardia arthritidis]QIS08697.1 hypothetical protein F5544_03915 [Nocardia arthritidis]